MPQEGALQGNPLQRVWRFLKRQVVDDTPAELEICEFDCRKDQCVQDEWATCEKRTLKGAGELYPESAEAKKVFSRRINADNTRAVRGGHRGD
jgi:hypothetical protein